MVDMGNDVVRNNTQVQKISMTKSRSRPRVQEQLSPVSLDFLFL